MKNIRPPAFILGFLEWFCPPALHESVEGDILEDYERDVDLFGERKARRRLLFNVLRFFRPGIILRNKFSITIMNTIMLGNYVKVAVRNIQKRRLYSFINAFGLSIGIAFCILIYLFIQDERKFDQFHEDKEWIYRVHTTEFDQDAFEKGEKSPYQHSAKVPIKLGDAMLEELPEIKHVTRFMRWAGVMQYKEKVFKEADIVYVDSGFFEIFSFPLISGNKEKLFRSNSDAVLTDDLARKYFGEDDPIGKTFIVDDSSQLYTVAAVISSPPSTSSLQFSMLLPVVKMPLYEYQKDYWFLNSFPLFVQTIPNIDPAALKSNLDKLSDKYIGESNKSERSQYKIPDEFKVREFNLIKLADIHLANHVSWDKISDPKYAWILGSIALMILIMASINYVSLALTTSASRRVEIGVRKVIGAQRKQLVYQFGLESIILALLSMVLGIGMAMFFLPVFNQFTEKSIALTLDTTITMLLAALLITLIIGMVAGSYPALFLSRFRPVVVLKKLPVWGFRTGFVRTLVVMQFFISAFLMISAVIMFNQMKYIASKNLGYNKEHVIAIENVSNNSLDVLNRFRNALKDNPRVLNVAGVNSSFGDNPANFSFKVGDQFKSVHAYIVDPEYVKLLEMEIVSGRNFNRDMISDKQAVIVNEALVKDMGWKDPLNEYFKWKKGGPTLGYKVIGVVKDYHFFSLEHKIEPMFLSIDGSISGLWKVLIKISPDNIPENLENIKNTWIDLFPDKPFVYSFMEDAVEKQYKSYTRWTNITSIATFFAIVIACLGLFGLAGISAVNRTKEIGIRKVLGAGISNIFVLLNKQYVWLSLIAYTLAIPFSWYIMNQWLSNFQFKIAMGVELFIVAMGLGIVVALLTVSYHAIKASLINPADTLKHE